MALVNERETLWQRALSDEIRAELARNGGTAKAAYTSLGVSSTAWQTYFVRYTREIPSGVLIDVARYLGMPLSELMRRTEAREAVLLAAQEPAATLSEHVARQTSPEAQVQIRAARARVAKRQG